MEDDFCMSAWRSKSPNSTYTFPWFLVTGKLSYEYDTGQMRLPFRLGSWHFELLMTGSHFSDLLHFLEEGLAGDLHTHTESLLQMKVRDALLTKIKELGTSLESYRRVWLVPFDRIKGIILDIQPGRTIGGDWGLSVYMPDLPLFSWTEIQVIAPVGPDRYKVRIRGNVFECYTPRHAAIFSEEIPLWRLITFSPEAYDIRAPKLKGLVRTDRYEPGLRGILYDWIEPWPEARNLADVIITQVTRRQREIWYAQVARSVEVVHKLGLRCTSRHPYWSRDVDRKIIIDDNLNANFSMIAFGNWHPETSTYEEAIIPEDRQRWRLDTSPEPDFAFLDILYEFLRVEPRRNIIRASFSQANHELAPSNWGSLPADLRNMIYERVLVGVDPVIYRHGVFARQVLRTSKLSANSTSNEKPIPGVGLFRVSRGMRQESLSFFIGRNPFHIEAIELRNFIHSLGHFAKYIRKVTIVVVLSDDDELSRTQCMGIMELQEKAASLRYVNMIVRNTGGLHWREQPPILALYNFRGLQSFEVAPKTRGILARERKEMEESIRLEVLQLSSVA